MTNFLRGRADLNPVYLATLKWAQEVEAERLADYRLYQDYYDGNHDVRVPEKMREVLSPYLGIRDNFIEVIVDALVERLTVTGFAANDESIAARCWEFWNRNDLDEVADDVHFSAILKGDGFILVDFDNETGQPRARYQAPETITVEYDDDSNTTLYRAAKRWTFRDVDDSGKVRLRTRLNVYYADRVEKYISTGTGEGATRFEPYRDDDDDAWPLPWVDPRTGDPLGVPLFHFRPRARGDVYGRSEIANAIPQQDALNKMLVDLLVVADTQGFPQRWVAGAKAPAGGFLSGPGVVWRFDNPQAVAGQFDQASLEHLLAAIAMLVNHIAARSRTPQHLFSTTGTYPSGEALKTAEAGLVSKARRRMVAFGNVWEDVLAYMLRLDNTFGTASWNLENPGLVVQWADPETQNELLHTQAVMLKSPVIGKRQTLREMGYSEQDIARITSELEEEEAQKASLGSALLDSFMQNQQPDLNPAQVVGAPQETNADAPDTTQPPRFSGQ